MQYIAPGLTLWTMHACPLDSARYVQAQVSDLSCSLVACLTSLMFTLNVILQAYVAYIPCNACH